MSVERRVKHLEAEAVELERRVMGVYARILPLLDAAEAEAVDEAAECDEASPLALAGLHHLWAHARADERAALLEYDGPRFWLGLEESDEGDGWAGEAPGGGDGDSGGCGGVG